MSRIARRLRILVAAIVCVLASLGFVGIIPMLPQAGTSMLNAVATGAAAALIAALLFVAFTYLFGRFYCAALCPLGILQDFIGWISRKRNGTRKNLRMLRYAILALAAGFALAGWVVVARMVEPFSLFGRIFGGLALPGFSLTMQELGVSWWTGAYTATTAGMGFGAATLLLLIVLVWWRHRIFCTSICPVGTLLGLFAKYGVFKMALSDSTCVHCGKCAKACPAGCIDVKAETLDNERCLRCMNCIAVCRTRGIVWHRGASKNRKHAKLTADPTRRGFLLGMIGTTLASFGLGRGLKPGSAKGVPARPAIYPPGAGSAERFTSKCTACLLCVANCRGNVLLPPDSRNRFVHLDYSVGMCEFNCNACSQVCPTGAIRPLALEKKKLCRIGMAVFHPDVCIAVVEGTACGACAEHCPTGALRMVQEPGDPCPAPVLNEDLCIGCGNCSHPCPVTPVTAMTISPIPIQVEAEDPQTYFKKQAAPLAPETDDWLL
ncbi:MAG: hypothetical protein PWQ29_1368 [Verrucomicrobiota bacterium]|jgi:ferredoxin|nr:hypothetical protein [Verrucomicrobiota bacterium]